MLYQVIKTADLPKVIPGGMTVYSISRNDGKKGKSGIVAVMPQITDAVRSVFLNDPVGVAYITDRMEWLRGKVASAVHARGETIHDEKIGITALLALARQETESQRMTKESIGEWFDSDVASLIAARIKEKMVGIADDKVTKLVEGYRASFESLSVRELSMSNAKKEQMLKVFELLPEDYDHVIAVKALEKLNSISEATETLAAL